MTQRFFYKARNSAGKLVRGNVEAENRKKAIELIRERKLFVVELYEAHSGEVFIALEGIFKKKVSPRELAVLCRQFATMTQAGIPILQCLTILIQQCDNKTIRETLKKVSGKLEGGMSLAESLKSFPHVFPRIFVSMVEAGEVGGAMDRVLDRLAVNFDKEHDLIERVKSAVTYPMFVVSVAVLTVAALLVLVIPKFITLLTEMKAPIPITTQLIILCSNFMVNFWYMVLLIIAVAVFGYKRALCTERGKRMKDRIVLILPVFGPIIRKIIIYRFCRSLSVLLKSGVPVLESLDVVKKIAGNYTVVKGIKDAEDSIKEGQSISSTLHRSGIFPPMVTRMMAIGEETGALDTLLEKIADFYERETEDLVSRLSAMLEPVLIVSMGGVVGFIILSIMLPMFSVLNNVR